MLGVLRKGAGSGCELTFWGVVSNLFICKVDATDSTYSKTCSPLNITWTPWSNPTPGLCYNTCTTINFAITP